MTILVAWVAWDSRAPSSIYLASDSRISWGTMTTFDYGRKVFGCSSSPELFGYCGDVLFPSIILSQLTELIDLNLIFIGNETAEEKFKIIYDFIKDSFEKYPKKKGWSRAEIVYCTRNTSNDFFIWKMIFYLGDNSLSSEFIQIDVNDTPIAVGSGAKEFKQKFTDYNDKKSDIAKTSRAVFQCLFHTLSDINDPYCGGAPQLVGLYRIGNARKYGIIKDGERFFMGKQLFNVATNLDHIEWRNDSFEVCDGLTTCIKSGSQRQPNPHLR